MKEGFPRRVRSGEAEYLLRDDCAAFHDIEPPPRARVLARLPDEKITVVEIERSSVSGVTPVYSIGGGPVPFVPTGRIFIRFNEGDTVDAHSRELTDAGFRIEATRVPYAAWLKTESGDIAAALQAVEKLRSLEGVESVEPQMLTERKRRSR